MRMCSQNHQCGAILLIQETGTLTLLPMKLKQVSVLNDSQLQYSFSALHLLLGVGVLTHQVLGSRLHEEDL
jgi:hypothetical protein